MGNKYDELMSVINMKQRVDPNQTNLVWSCTLQNSMKWKNVNIKNRISGFFPISSTRGLIIHSEDMSECHH